MATDKRDTLIAYLTEGLKICNGLCNICPTKDPIIMGDEKLYDDPFVTKALEEKGYPDTTGALPEDICPLGLSLGRMVKNYGMLDATSYKQLILSCGGNIIYDSVKKLDPPKIQKTMTFAIIDLIGSKNEVPFVPETTKVILHREPLIEIPTSRMSTSARRFLEYP